MEKSITSRFSRVPHTAIIPARAGSVGFPGKNRLFFANTADFIDSIDWFERVIVSTDDSEIHEMAHARGYDVHERSAELAGGAVSIKAVFEDLVPAMEVRDDEWLWLFYLPVLYKNRDDFEMALKLTTGENLESLCSFVPAKTHPFDCWRWDENAATLRQYTPNDVFRRQDKPPAWQHYHYICCLRARVLPLLNSELICEQTRPLLLDEEKAANLIEVDTKEDWQRWKKHLATKMADR